MVRYKVLASLIITALVLLFSGHSVSAISTTFNRAYTPGIDAYSLTTYRDGTNSPCSGATTSLSRAGGQAVQVGQTVFYSNSNCSTPLTSTAGDIVTYNFTVYSRTVNAVFIRAMPINTSVKEFDIIDITVQQASLSSGSVSSSNFGASNRVSLTVRYNSSGAWYGWSARGDSWIFSLFNPNSDADSYWISWNSIVVQTESSQLDTDEANDYYEQQNQGNTNIEGQDTTGDSQGVSDGDYSSLLDIFTGFISAITNVSGGSCTISLNTDFANLGNVDLCTYDPPSYIQVIGSIILILLFVPLSMALIKRILKTIQELQQ